MVALNVSLKALGERLAGNVQSAGPEPKAGKGALVLLG